MAKIRVHSFSVSIDGFGAGLNQDINNPLGVRGPELFDWFFATRVWRKMHGLEGGETGIDNDIAEQGFAGIGAWIIGRNMFGPIRDPWPGEDWKGWWGEEPPHHTPVFVLTNYSRASLKMKGGTEFHFVTEGIHDALEQAIKTAKDGDVRVGGGVATLRQYLRAALIDEIHLAVRPIRLGSGEHLYIKVPRASAVSEEYLEGSIPRESDRWQLHTIRHIHQPRLTPDRDQAYPESLNSYLDHGVFLKKDAGYRRQTVCVRIYHR